MIQIEDSYNFMIKMYPIVPMTQVRKAVYDKALLESGFDDLF